MRWGVSLSDLPLAIGWHNGAAEPQVTDVFMHTQPVLGQNGFRAFCPIFLAAVLPKDRVFALSWPDPSLTECYSKILFGLVGSIRICAQKMFSELHSD